MSRVARTDRTWLVAAAAAMWGLDGLLRQPLAERMNPATVVLWEHIIAVIVLIPFLWGAIKVFLRCAWRDRVAIILVGAGASAVATALFTKSFAVAAQTGDYVTPLVLQKLQPLFAIAMAVWLLGERLRASYWLYAVPALIGAWLLTFADPFDIKVSALQAALLAIGAAALWASGTVLGRMVTSVVSPRDLVTLRFIWGLIAAFVVATLVDAPLAPGEGNLTGLVLLALIPGLISLGIYYVALRATAASRATLAEMAFPATAAFVGVVFLGADLSWSQWIGFAIVVASITTLGLRERQEQPTVEAPERVRVG